MRKAIVLAGLLGGNALAAEFLCNQCVVKTLSVNGKSISIGDSREAALQALGGEVKVIRKPWHSSANAIVRNADLAIKLGTVRIDSEGFAASNNALVDACGDSCFIGIVEKRLASKEVVKISFVGPSKEDMKVGVVMFDRGSVLKLGTQEDAGGRFYVTDDGLFRVVITKDSVSLAAVSK